MSGGAYQRRFLRAPLKEKLLYADGSYVLKAMTLNISEDGLLIDELPAFPVSEDVALMISLPIYPQLKNLSNQQLDMISFEEIPRKIIRAKARMVRKGELSQDIDNIFKQKFGLQFVHLTDDDKKVIQHYVSTFVANTIHLQTQIDSFNFEDEAKKRTRSLSRVLGYERNLKIAELRVEVSRDYQSMQWL